MKMLPCVIFAFNRPKKLRRVLKSLEHQNIDKLILFVDGPRNADDRSLVDRCRTIGKQIDWVETEFYFWSENKGLSGLSDNVRLVFEKYPWAVFVEDDCLPMPGFYELMRQALIRYETDKHVFSIGGYQYLKPNYFIGYPFSFVSCLRFTCWGWASWYDRWASIQPLINQYELLFDHLSEVPDIVGKDLPEVALAMASGQAVVSWDVKVGLATLSKNWVHLLPTKGVIRNIGHDRSGIHGSWSEIIRSMLYHNRNVISRIEPESIKWLDDVSVNEDYMDVLRQQIDNAKSFSLRRLFGTML